MLKSEKHSWTVSDDLKVLLVYLYDGKTQYTIERVANSIGIPKSKARTRLENFRYVDGNGTKGGLEHASHQTRFVFNAYKSLSMSALEVLAFEYDVSVGKSVLKLSCK